MPWTVFYQLEKEIGKPRTNTQKMLVLVCILSFRLMYIVVVINYEMLIGLSMRH